ncbi:unnamed protein product [Gordionus sp. m RMFG-2023]
MKLSTIQADKDNIHIVKLGRLKFFLNNLNPKWVSLILLVLQTTCTILITRYSRTSHGSVKSPKKIEHPTDISNNDVKYLSSTAVLFSEILKVVICLIIVYYNQGQSLSSTKSAVREHVFNSPAEMGKIFVPAALYTLQNNLIFLALSNLNAATYQVTYQLKLFTTAFFSVILLGRRLNIQKWFSLLLLMLGVILVQIKPEEDTLDKIHKSDSKKDNNTLVGILAVLSACMCSGFSGVYFEKLLKQNSSKISLWIRNIQLGVWGIIIAFLGAVIYDYEKIKEGGFLQGYDKYTVMVIVLQALGGLIIATVIKYADNIVKGFANAISISLSALLSHYLLQDFDPTKLFALGTFVVILATVLYGYEPSKKSSASAMLNSSAEKTGLVAHLHQTTPKKKFQTYIT